VIKICEYCEQPYGADKNKHNAAKQKYCSISCKDKAQYKKNKAEGNIRSMKSGYPRKLSIKKYMEARNSDITVPCHYCQTRLTPETFQLDHKVAMSKGGFTTRAEIQNESNLVVCCADCNKEKGNTYTYEEFKELKHG